MTFARPVLALCLTLAVSACGGLEETTIGVCPALGRDEVLVAPVVSPTGVWDVTYTATVTGGPSVTSLQYRDSAGILQTVANPSFPFTYTMLSKPPGTRVTLSATASAPPGLVSLEILAVSGPANAREQMRWSSACGN